MARLMPAGLAAAPVAVVPIGVDASALSARCRAVDGPPWRLLRVASINRGEGLSDAASTRWRCLVARGLDVHLDVVGEDTMNGSVQALARDAGPRVRASRSMDFSRPIGWRPSTRARTCTWCRRATRRRASSCSKRRPAGWRRSARRSATSRTGIRDRALAVPVQDPAALANAIADLLHDPPRRERLASAAREWTLAHDADWTAAQFERIYGEVAVGKGSKVLGVLQVLGVARCGPSRSAVRAGLKACTTFRSLRALR